MIYLTGDTHCDFRRFDKSQLERLQFKIKEQDSVIICGDFGLLWARDEFLDYNLDMLSKLPFRILWVQGNHENYNMIEGYPLEEWNGGKVRHIVRDKIILLERGQVFTIEGKKFFTFGGGSSHDIQGGILDPDADDYAEQHKRAIHSGLCFRVLGKSWWVQELPTEEEMAKGLQNLERIGYTVDYVISHCMSTRMQNTLALYHHCPLHFQADILTNYFDKLEDMIQYKQWFCGHYHEELQLDVKHRVLYEDIVPLSEFE